MATPGGPDGSGYFLYHSIGMFPGKAQQTAAALAQVAAAWGTPDDAGWATSLALRRDFLARWRALLAVPEGTITTAENVTTALCSLIGALPDRLLRGRKLLVAADCFPSLHFLLSGMAARRGFELVTVPVRPGENWVCDEDLLAHWRDDVGVALLTWVTSTSSHRCDLRRLVAHGRAMGTLVGVDITQGIGIVPLETAPTPPDFIVSTSLKWLCGVAGAGILQVREPLLAQCHPELRGWFSQEDPFAWSLDTFEYARDARRFDHGTPSILPFAACIPALDWHARQDPAALLAHNRRLSQSLLDACGTLGLELAGPRSVDERGGSLMFRLPPGTRAEHLVAQLRRQSVFVDCRGPLLRLSPGAMTTAAGVERLMHALPAALRAAR